MIPHTLARSILVGLTLAAPVVTAQTPPPAAALAPGTAGAPGLGLGAPKRLVVLLDGGLVGDLLQLFQLTLADSLVAPGLHLLEAPLGTTDEQLSLILAGLQGQPGVVFAEPDRQARSTEVESCASNGQGGSTQAGAQECTIAFVDGTPTQAEYSKQQALAQIHAFRAQRIPAPFTPLVAVIDTGIDPSHPALHGHFLKGWDFVDGKPRGFDTTNDLDDDGDGLVDEAYGHGTHVAGTILAVAPGAMILPVRCLDAEGAGSGYRVAEALFYATDAGADVINMSLSMEVTSLAVVAGLPYAEAHGVTVMTSAGNTGDEVLFPGNYDPLDVTWTLPLIGDAQLSGAPVITVTAVNNADVRPFFAAWGSHVDLSAPGVNIYGPVPGNGYAWWSGTSMATAVASGAAALMIGISGPAPLTDAAALLQDNADDIDQLNPGYEQQLGHGRIDAFAAGIDAAIP